MSPQPIFTIPDSSLSVPCSSNSSSAPKYPVARRAKERKEDEYEDDSEDVENDSGDDYSEDGRKPPKSRKGLNGLSVGSSKSSRQRPTLPKAGPWHPDYVLTQGGVAQMKNRKDLNISAGYGKDNFWPRSAGLRELIQNMFDGALAALKAKSGCGECTAKDIEARPIFPPTGDWGGFPLKLHQVPFGQKLTFELHHKAPAAASPSKRSRKKEPLPLGWVSFKATGYGKCNLELYNGGQPLDFDCMTFGFSSKVGESDFIGQHGDGMKMGINAIIRQQEGSHEYPPEVFYVTGKKQWDFLYVDDLLEAHQTQSKVPKVHGVLTQVTRFPSKSVRFEDFLFLRPAVDILETDLSGRHRVGAVLLDERLRYHIFAKGVFVQKRPDRTVGLHYGIDIWQDVEISRDRVGLQDDEECSDAAFDIWKSLFESSERARQLYIELLIHHDSCIETHYIAEQLERADARLLFDQLRKDEGDDVFFYHAEDAGESVRIIEQVLKKKPFLIPRNFCQALLKCEVIITPEQARMKRFRSLSTSKHYNGDSPQLKYTAHLIKAFLDMDPDMMRFWDCFHFKSASANMGVEIVVDGGKVLLHDLTLSSVYIHRKPQFIMCFRHLRAADSLEKAESDKDDNNIHLDESLGDEQELVASEAERFWADDLSVSVCDCSALYVLHLMTQELTNVSTMRKTELEMGRQLALRSLPRNLTFEAIKPSHYTEDDAPLEMTLSWSTDDDLSGFKIFVHSDVEKHTEPLLSEKEDEEIRTMDATPMPSTEPRADDSDDGLEVDLISDSNRIILNDRIPNGKKYIAQVCWDKPGALYSLPLSFAIPPTPPPSTSLKIEYQAPKVTVEWDASPESGADSWIVVLKWKDREIFRKAVDAPNAEVLLDEELGEDYLLAAEVYAKSSACGLISTNFASKVVRHEAPPPPPPAFPSNHGSSSTAMSSASPLVKSRKSLASGIEQTASSTPKKASSSQTPAPRPNQSLPIANSIASTSTSISRQDTLFQSNLTSTRDSSPGLGYVDRFGGFDSDSDDDDPATGSMRPVHKADYGYNEMPVNVDVDLITDCLQAKIVARAAPLDMDDSSYFPVKTIFIDHQKFSVDNHYAVQLRSCDGAVHEVIIYVHSIRYPQDPRDEASNVAVLQLSQYINWNLVHPDAPDNGLLLLFSEAEFMGTSRDSETFSASAIVKVRECVQVSYTLDSDATSTTRRFICNWSLRRIGSCKPGTVETFVMVPEHLHVLKPPLKQSAPPLRIGSLTFGDIFCGAGGASCGFKEAGFTPEFGVEASSVAGGAFEKNCRAAHLYNKLDMFLGYPWSKEPLQTAVISVCPPSGIFTVDKHPVIQAVDTFKPAYVVYNCSMDQLSANNIGDLRKLQYRILKLGYGFTYGVLKATDFGVSTIRNRLVLIAAAPAQHMPELPSPTHGGTDQPSTPTLQHAISDLDWNNPTCNSGLQSEAAHPANRFQSVSRHCTGCIVTDFGKWDDSRTVADWNEPLPALLTVPSEKWKCRHPSNPQRFLTVREMARALSFPDSWDFSGSLKDQYSQVANSLPPLLAKAIAEEIKRVIVKCNPHLVSAL